MQYPTHISRTWLWRTIPTLTARQFNALCKELERRGWGGSDGNDDIAWFLEGGLPLAVRREARMLR